MDGRLPAHLEITGLIRAIQAAGGFGTVLAKGEKHAGTLMVVCCENGTNAIAYERMPQLDGTRKWTPSKAQDPENPYDFTEYCEKRKAQDRDLWIVELDAASAKKILDQSTSLS